MLRELRSEMGKYAVIAILLIATIGFVSGFLVAGSSMIAAYNEGFEKYNIEDGHFRVEKQLNRAQLKAITGAGPCTTCTTVRPPWKTAARCASTRTAPRSTPSA